MIHLLNTKNITTVTTLVLSTFLLSCAKDNTVKTTLTPSTQLSHVPLSSNIKLTTEQKLLSSKVIKSNKLATNSDKLSFLAFGDGGYHYDYPKTKHIQKPLNKAAFIAKEKQDWLEEHRPIDEFNHAPLYVYPHTETTTELGGAASVGLAMKNLCETIACEFAIQLGDNIYPDGADDNDGKDDQQRMNDLILKPLQPLLNDNKDLIVYSALGNHDWKSSRKGVALQTEWMKKQPNFYMSERGYYRYTIGSPGNDVEFFVLDTNMLLSGQKIYEIPLNSDGSEVEEEEAKRLSLGELDQAEPHENPVNGEDKKQLEWLNSGLVNSTAKWKIVYGHHILWSIGGTKYSEGHTLRKLIMPTLCEYADAYIAGHEHDLELLTDDCSLYTEINSDTSSSNSDEQSIRAPLPLIISGAASKMRGKHTPFAEQQEKRYPEYDLLWSKSFVWGFAHVTLNNKTEKLSVEYFTTPTNESGEVIKEVSFSFPRRSH